MDRMRRLERRHDALELRAEPESSERFFVGDGDVLDPFYVAQEGVLRPHAWIVETGGDRVRREDLSVAVLEDVRIAAVQDARATADE